MTAASEPLVVSEDGHTTASFTAVLATEPLSAVSVTFLSRFGGLAFNPASVSFDYTNFDVPATVSVSGVDDFVDQGFSHSDSVFAIAASADSLEECLEADRPACGQAAKYANFSAPQGLGHSTGGDISLNATVMDNDEAGLLLSDLAVNSTYDNFGDPLHPGKYTIRLASKPTSVVTIDIGGLGPFANATPHFFSIEPEAWNTPVPIFINAGAPSRNRPICSNGKRFCSEITGRIQNLTHDIASTDPVYKALALTETARVYISVVYDATDPPQVVSTSFTNLLNSITIAFDMQARRKQTAVSNGGSSSFECANVLALTGAEVSHYFGAGAYCTFSAPSVLKVTFGTAASVAPSDKFALRPLAISSAAVGASLRTLNERFVVGLPARPTAPTIVLAASSTAVGICDDLVVDGSSSYGSGGRDMTYHWSVVAENELDVKNISSVLEMANTANGNKGAHSASVHSSSMVQGSRFTVTLKVTNFLGLFDAKSVTVTKLGVPAPVLSIQGENPRFATHSGTLQLMATASLPEMSCVGMDLSNAKMGFTWHETTGHFGGPLAQTSKNPRILVLLPGTLQVGLAYDFRVVGRMTDTPWLNNSASVTVLVESQPVEARISGGAYRQIGRDLDFDLDGSSSYDPDDDPVQFSFFWSCKVASSDADCSGLISFANFSRPTLKVPSATLPVGYYLFSLFAAKGPRNDTALATVEITAGAPPVINVASLTSAKYNPSSYVSISATVTSGLSFSTLWNAVDSDVRAPFQVNGAAALTVSNKLSCVVKLSALTPGTTYTFSLAVWRFSKVRLLYLSHSPVGEAREKNVMSQSTLAPLLMCPFLLFFTFFSLRIKKATNSDGESSYSTLSLAINEIPSSGSVVVHPSKGFALDTAFAYNALNWVDEDLPLIYRFGKVPVNRDGSLDTSMATPFGDSRPSAALSGVTLSAGSNHTNYTVGCFAEVIDSLGSVGYAQTTIRVLIKPLSVGALRNISEAKALAALESNDADAAKQILGATLDSMSSVITENPLSGRRRQLLAEDSGTSGLLSSVLANLWATYEITPVTQPDVSSLLGTLVGIVDEPGLCTDQVTAGSFNFLNTVSRPNMPRDSVNVKKASLFLRASLKYLTVDHVWNNYLSFRQVLWVSYLGQVGVSESAVSHVASAFSFMIETPLFTTPDPKSLANAANVTLSLALASANQL